MAGLDNTLNTHRTGATTGITQHGDVAAAKRGAMQKAGAGAAAGATDTPPPPPSVGAATGFDAEYYLGAVPDVAEFTEADEKSLNELLSLVNEALQAMEQEAGLPHAAPAANNKGSEPQIARMESGTALAGALGETGLPTGNRGTGEKQASRDNGTGRTLGDNSTSDDKKAGPRSGGAGTPPEPENDGAGTPAATTNYVTRRRTQDLISLLSQIMNLERSGAIQRISNHTQNNISELKLAAKDMRDSANKLLIGAVGNIVLSAAGSLYSAHKAQQSLKNTAAADNKLKEGATIQKELNTNETKLDNLRAERGKVGISRKEMGRIEQEIYQTKESIISDNQKQKRNGLEADAELKEADAWTTMGRTALEFSRSAGHFTESMAQVFSKKDEADMAEKQANAQLEQGTKDMALQNLNAIKTMVEALLNAFKEIRDTQDQVKANIARNA